MRISINLPEELVKQIDAKAKAMYITRSAYIATSISSKLKTDKMQDDMPQMLLSLSKLSELLESEDKLKGKGINISCIDGSDSPIDGSK